MSESAVNACQLFSRSLCLLINQSISLQQKCLKKWIESPLLGTRRYNFQPLIPTLSATVYSVTDRWTDGQTTVTWQWPGLS